MRAVPLTKSSFAASRKTTKTLREINALAKLIANSRETLPWHEFECNIHKGKFTLLGVPDEFRPMIEKESVHTFRLASLSEAEGAAKFEEMRKLFNELHEEYQSSGGAVILYIMIRMIILAIIAVQRAMVLQHADYGVASPALQFVEVIDNDGRMRTERMQTLVICPNNFST